MSQAKKTTAERVNMAKHLLGIREWSKKEKKAFSASPLHVLRPMQEFAALVGADNAADACKGMH